MRNSYKILVAEGWKEESLPRSRHRWNDNIKTALKETAYEIVIWI
jgi:hypothetical protein